MHGLKQISLTNCSRIGKYNLLQPRNRSRVAHESVTVTVRCSATKPPNKDGQPDIGHRALSLLQRPAAAALLWAAYELPASADVTSSGPPAESYYVTLGLFVLSLPGLWSLIKRSPKAKIKRKTLEVAGPAVPGAMPLNARAQQILDYFTKYNYVVKDYGDVITFEGNYKASVGQAAALVLYTFLGLGSAALVLSIAAPFGGNWWYSMCVLSPAAGAYYMKNADRTEQIKVKMVTADDDSVTDIVVEGDDEEIDRMSRELQMIEKGKVYVKGLLES